MTQDCGGCVTNQQTSQKSQELLHWRHFNSAGTRTRERAKGGLGWARTTLGSLNERDPGLREGAGQGDHQPGFSEASNAVGTQVPAFAALPPSSTHRIAPTPPSIHSTHSSPPLHHSSDSSGAWLSQPSRNPAYRNKRLRDWPLRLPAKPILPLAVGPSHADQL